MCIDKVKFLIIRFSSIGDIVLTSPVIRCIKEQVKNSEVHFLTKNQFKEILNHNPYIDKVHTLSSVKETVSNLKKEQYDYVIDLHKNLRSYRIKSKLKVMDFSVDKLNIKKWLLVNFKINKMPDRHIVDRYMDTVYLFDVKNDQKGLDFFITDKDKDINLPEPIRNKAFVSLVIGGNHYTKKLTREKLVELCRKINYPIVLLGGKEDNIIGEYILENTENTLNYCGELSLGQSAFLVAESSLVISHDTGLMHIAAAFKKPIFSIWGNTVPEFGMYPYLPDRDSLIFEVKNLKCRPCSKIGFKKCPKKHFKCMEEQNIDLIADKVNNFSM